MAGRFPALKARLASDKRLYYLLCLSILAGGILLMVLPAKLITREAPKTAELNLETTFSTLSSQGIICIVIIFFGFIVLVFDIVG